MKSLDTNILIYATNRAFKEHLKAKEIYRDIIQSPNEWVVADQILFEFYRILRSSRFLSKPLSANEAKQQLVFLRTKVGCFHCAYHCDMWPDIEKYLQRPELSKTRIFDLVLAVTLKHFGVTQFYTRNLKDFDYLDFFEVVNPID